MTKLAFKSALVAVLCSLTPSVALALEEAAPPAEGDAAAVAAPAAAPAEQPEPRERPEPPPAADEDDVRFRGGVALEGGVLAIPEAELNLGVAGVHGELGVQVNELVGVYAVPGFDIVFGQAGGLVLSAAILVDFTIEDIFTVGVGPDVGVFAAIGDTAVAAGANYGARLHLAVHPVFGEGSGGRRKAFSIGLDTRLLGGPVAAASTTATTATTTGFLMQPMLTIGYTAM